MQLNKKFKLTLITLAVASIAGCGASNHDYSNQPSANIESKIKTGVNSPIISSSSSLQNKRNIIAEKEQANPPLSNPDTALCIYNASKYKIDSINNDDSNDFHLAEDKDFIENNCDAEYDGKKLDKKDSRKIHFEPKKIAKSYRTNLIVNYSSGSNDTGSVEPGTIKATLTKAMFVDQSKKIKTTEPDNTSIPITNILKKDGTTYTYADSAKTENVNLQTKTHATHFGNNTFNVEDLSGITSREKNETFKVNIERYLSFTTNNGHVFIDKLDNNGNEQWVDLPGSQTSKVDTSSWNINHLIIDRPRMTSANISYDSSTFQTVSGNLWWHKDENYFKDSFLTISWPSLYNKNSPTQKSVAKAIEQNITAGNQKTLELIPLSGTDNKYKLDTDNKAGIKIDATAGDFQLIPSYNSNYRILSSYNGKGSGEIYAINKNDTSEIKKATSKMQNMLTGFIHLNENSYTEKGDDRKTPSLQYHKAENLRQNVLAYFSKNKDTKTSSFNILKTDSSSTTSKGYTTDTYTVTGETENLKNVKHISCSEFNGDSSANPTDCYLISYPDNKKEVTIQEMKLSSDKKTAALTGKNISINTPVDIKYLKFDADTKDFIVSDGSSLYKYNNTATDGSLKYNGAIKQKTPMTSGSKITGLYEF